MKKGNICLDLALKEEVLEGRTEHSVFSHKLRTSLREVLEVLHQASRRSKVAALVLTLDNLSPGWARLSNLRRALIDFRRTGKPIYCFLQNGGNLEYYLASACDQIFMAPAAVLRLVGLATEVFFFREILDHFGIEPELQSVGEYKSAGEMFTRTEMSAEAREQWNALFDDYYAEFCNALADSRGLSREEIAARIDAGPYSVREAQELKLIDGICYKEDVIGKLGEKLKVALRPVSAMKYEREGSLKRIFTLLHPRIAIIDILGTLESGESRRSRTGRRIAGIETIGKFLDQVRKSRRVRAAVVRIDSPGGTAIASDLLWHKISSLRECKPVVVSIGDTAASGGYYIAVAATAIFAETTSITGSIGVLGGKFVAKRLLNHLKIHRESVSRGRRAEFDSLFSPFSQGESKRLERLERLLEEFYRENFVKRVASGRKMDEEAVDRIGRGRIWSGLKAKEHGLIDELGGLREAIMEARRLAAIPEKRKVRLMHYVRRRRLWEMLIPDMAIHADSGMQGQPFECIEILERFAKNAILLLLPFQIRIR